MALGGGEGSGGGFLLNGGKGALSMDMLKRIGKNLVFSSFSHLV